MPWRSSWRSSSANPNKFSQRRFNFKPRSDFLTSDGSETMIQGNGKDNPLSKSWVEGEKKTQCPLQYLRAAFYLSLYT